MELRMKRAHDPGGDLVHARNLRHPSCIQTRLATHVSLFHLIGRHVYPSAQTWS